MSRAVSTFVEMTKLIQQRQALDAQLNENQVVKEELKLLKPDTTLYKSVGPVLLKVDLVEAKHNVSAKVDLISNEVKKIEDKIMDLEKKRGTIRESQMKLERQLASSMKR